MPRKLTSEEQLAKCREAHGNHYDYSNTIFGKSTDKVNIDCPIHGTFSQIARDHWNGRGCSKCGSIATGKSKRLDKEEILKRIKDVHGDKYEYDESDFEHGRKKIKIYCKVHEEYFDQRLKDHLKGRGCPKCGKESMAKTQSLTTEEFIEKSVAIYGNLYEYSKVKYENCYSEVKIFCKKCNDYFIQRANDHLMSHGCQKCAIKENAEKKRDSLEDAIEKAKEVHGDKYSYHLITEYPNGRTKLPIWCNAHKKVFYQKFHNHIFNKSGCPSCSTNISNMEKELQEFIKKYYDIKTNSKKVIKPKELDIYIPEKKIAIEFDGIYWHSELNGKGKYYHIDKTKECNKKGIRLIHIFENEWTDKQFIVKSRIKSILGKTKYKIHGRKCTIKEIDVKTKSKFLNKYHIQGTGASSIRLGAYYKNRLVAVMTFGKRRFDNKDGYELIRYATISNFSCIGVAGKLLKHFELTYNPSVIVSYADLRWSEGNLYKKLGFTHLHNSNPNYYYTKKSKVIGNRISFQKHKLKDKLDKYDPNMTEWENMKANGYDRIWDCGNMVFEKRLN